MSTMSIYESTFAQSDKTDAILIVGYVDCTPKQKQPRLNDSSSAAPVKKMYVNKALLSCHSDYFDALFNSNFIQKSMQEIDIEDVKFEDFATLLSLV
ncbi:hypothetical protein CRE_11427 [Caenorhabditis remanei]|uniref:BTB domain-containing protein n=1 Tax=Caenorhabditis remanei TaxID=31234 RepID=E3NBF8_CAERE|nr:hypothetical protein CRE_11427 [Caenorhabditis remanei]